MPTQQQLNAGKQVVLAVAETIREAGECPSGTIYAALVGRVTFEGYQKILGILQNAGLVEQKANHMLRWIGPSIAASR